MRQKNNLSREILEEDKPPGVIPFYPYYFQTSLTRSQKDYYRSNGHFLLLKNLQVEVFSHLDDCQAVWEEFSPKETLFDTWDFRLAFYQGYKYQPYFLVLKKGGEHLALLPLWWEKDKKIYTWFGSQWQEENKFLVKDPIFIPLILAAAPSPLVLNALDNKIAFWLKEVIKFKEDDPKYTLDLTVFKSSLDYLATLKKKKRYNLKRDRRIIEAQKPEIIFNNFSDFETLVELSIKRFKEKGEDTDWEDKRRLETFRWVIKLGRIGREYKIRMITVKIGGKVVSVDLIALYNGCYYPLKCGYNVKEFSGIGNYVNQLEIDDAISLGMKKIDFLEIDYGWKQKWFKPIPLLYYEKKHQTKKKNQSLNQFS